METLLLTFANSRDNPLNCLKEEDDEINAVLRKRDSRNDFKLVRDQFATRKNIIGLLREYKEDICLFWFSGHAGRDQLILEDGSAPSDAIARLLGECPKLKLVGLNGCSTNAQTEALLRAGVPMVISTNARVHDEAAAKFAISFFTSFAAMTQGNELRDCSVREAFKQALKDASVFSKIEIREKIDLHVRGWGGSQNKNVSKSDDSLWELIYSEKAADLIDTWRLPKRPLDSTVNKYLRKALEQIAKNYPETDGQQDTHTDVLLSNLPFTTSEPIRKLLAPRKDNNGQVFYDKPSLERYRMLLYAYQSIGNLLCFSLLSQLWQVCADDKDISGLSTIEPDFRDWLITGYMADGRGSMLPFFHRLVGIFRSNKISFFFPELEEALKKMDEEEYSNAFRALEEMIAGSHDAKIGCWDDLCEETEKNLALVLFCFGFLFRYTLTSVKDINVLYYMHNKVPVFEHAVVPLLQETSLQEKDIRDRRERHLRTASIVLHHVSDKHKFLYLSPFIIDENAYTRTAKANPRFCIAYDREKRYFKFKSISDPSLAKILKIKEQQVDGKDIILYLAREEDNDFFPLIHGQFSGFCETVFGKTLDEL